MHEALIQLIHPQTDWHVVELTPTTLSQAVVKETADLLICDHLSAHVPDVKTLLADWVQALKPGGWLAVLDTVVPGSRLRGKKANLQRRAGEYVNELLRWGEGGNGRTLSQDEWLDILRVVNIRNIQHETQKRPVELHTWTSAVPSTPSNRSRLRALLEQAPDPVTAFLTPHSANDRITFYLTELTLVGRLEDYKE